MSGQIPLNNIDEDFVDDSTLISATHPSITSKRLLDKNHSCALCVHRVIIGFGGPDSADSAANAEKGLAFEADYQLWLEVCGFNKRPPTDHTYITSATKSSYNFENSCEDFLGASRSVENSTPYPVYQFYDTSMAHFIPNMPLPAGFSVRFIYLNHALGLKTVKGFVNTNEKSTG